MDIFIDESPIVGTLETIYMTWFTLEFVCRFLSCPDYFKFLRSFMNIIDILAILPYYLEPLLDQLESVKTVGQILRILRIIFVFKLAHYSRGLQGLGYSMKYSYKELGLILMFFGILTMIFSSLVYIFEKDEKEASINNIFDSFWWAVITMTTVG